MMKMTHSSIAQLVFYERPVVVVGTETNDLVERSLEVRGCLVAAEQEIRNQRLASLFEEILVAHIVQNHAQRLPDAEQFGKKLRI